jgi:hypothetical protein
MKNSSYTKDKVEQVQDLERYNLITDYFIENPSRMYVNRNYIYNLYGCIENSTKDAPNKVLEKKITSIWDKLVKEVMESTFSWDKLVKEIKKNKETY